MIAYPEIDPVVVALGPVKIHWYGMMYLIAFASVWWLGKRRASQPHSIIRPDQIDDLVFYGALGAVLGGRIGSVFFYNIDSFINDPLYLLKIWQGGMSFHGGFMGVLVAMEWYRRKIGCSFFQLTDFIAPLIPLGLAAGRLGNFINAELWGAPGTVPWAMKLSCEQFPPDQFVDFAGPLCFSPRHPSPIQPPAPINSKARQLMRPFQGMLPQKIQQARHAQAFLTPLAETRTSQNTRPLVRCFQSGKMWLRMPPGPRCSSEPRMDANKRE